MLAAIAGDVEQHVLRGVEGHQVGDAVLLGKLPVACTDRFGNHQKAAAIVEVEQTALVGAHVLVSDNGNLCLVEC